MSSTAPESATPIPSVPPATKKMRGKARKLKKPKSADGSMSIVAHIEELRRRVFIALLGILAGTVLGYIWYGTAVGPIPSLGDILREPYCSLPPEMRFGSNDGECKLLATTPFEMFLLRLKVGSLAGLVFSSPIWLGQIWGFVTPGLKKNERRWALSVSFAASFLFVVGAIMAYFVLSVGLEFLLGIGDEAQIAALNGTEYFGFAISLLLIFGVSFEVPLLTVLLNAAGIISYKDLNEKRRYIIAFLFVFAAVITPGQEPISMVFLAVALCLLMEIATQIARVNDKRRAAKKREEWMDLDDSESSTIEEAMPLGEADPVLDAASPVTASSISPTDGLSNQFGEPVTATPAPRSSSGARPMQEDVYGRRTGLDLQNSQNPNNPGNSTGPDYFDDVL